MKTHTETGAGLTPRTDARPEMRNGLMNAVHVDFARQLERENAELRAALVGILADVPLAECNDFLHSKQDRHHGLDCPAQKRWEAAIEKARAALNSRP